MTGYYDLILGLIPASFLGTIGLLHVVGIGLMMAIPVAGFIALGIVAHGLFINGPVDDPRPTPTQNAATNGPAPNAAD